MTNLEWQSLAEVYLINTGIDAPKFVNWVIAEKKERKKYKGKKK